MDKYIRKSDKYSHNEYNPIILSPEKIDSLCFYVNELTRTKQLYISDAIQYVCTERTPFSGKKLDDAIGIVKGRFEEYIISASNRCSSCKRKVNIRTGIRFKLNILCPECLKLADTNDYCDNSKEKSELKIRTEDEFLEDENNSMLEIDKFVSCFFGNEIHGQLE